MAGRTLQFTQSTGTVARVLKLLQCFGDGPADWTLSALAEALHLPRSTVHRLLGLLMAEGFVDADQQTRQYRAGPELYRVGALLAARMPTIELAMPILRSIVAQADETTVLSLYYPKQLQKAFVAQVESARPMRYVIDLNLRHSLAWGASAHAILAHLDAGTITRALAQKEPSPSTGAQVDIRKLHHELARIRAEGYARSLGERVPTAIGLAVPVFGADGNVRGSLSVTYPENRMDERHNRKLIGLLRNGAQQLSAALGLPGAMDNDIPRSAEAVTARKASRSRRYPRK